MSTQPLRREVYNFTEANRLEIESHGAFGNVPSLVHLLQRAGSLSLQFSMLPHQARLVAKHLLECADEAEAMQAALAMQANGAEGRT